MRLFLFKMVINQLSSNSNCSFFFHFYLNRLLQVIEMVVRPRVKALLDVLFTLGQTVYVLSRVKPYHSPNPQTFIQRYRAKVYYNIQTPLKNHRHPKALFLNLFRCRHKF